MLLLVCSFAADPTAHAFQCNVCHSKNPAMVAMHKVVQAKEIGCFDCHKVGERLMGNCRPKDLQTLMTRRASESPCVECHINLP